MSGTYPELIGTIPQWLTLGGVVALVGAVLRYRLGWKKLADERETNLLSERAREMQDMRDRIEKLEAAAHENATDHLAEVRALERKQAAKDRLYEAQKAHDRHRINNLNQAFQAMLPLLKKGVPVDEVVVEIEGMRTEHLARETAEAATIRAAAIRAGVAVEEERDTK
jgi:hypothetical protein